MGGRSVGVAVLSALALSWIAAQPVAAQDANADQVVRLRQRQVARKPYDAAAYYRLGDAYIRKARESGDVTYFTLAEEALRKALAISPRYGDATRHLAFVLYSRHDFEGAATQARAAIELSWSDGQAHGILGDALLEVGRYAEAEEVYRRMIEIKGDLASYSRRAGLRSLRGDSKGAFEDLERAVELGKAAGLPRESIAWTQWQLGSDHFAFGNLAAAEAQYAESLRTFPGYYRALAGLGAVRAAQRKYEEAIDFYLQAIAVIPQPEIVAALGDVYTKLGRRAEARRQYELVEYIGRLNAINKVLYNRELASFYADHDLKLEEALALARKELDLRRDIYAHDLLAWALYKNGQPTEAEAAVTQALRLGTKDARLFFHAGMIHHRLGRADKAREYLGLALSTNPYFHLLHLEVAERTLGEIEAAQASFVHRKAEGDER